MGACCAKDEASEASDTKVKQESDEKQAERQKKYTAPSGKPSPKKIVPKSKLAAAEAPSTKEEAEVSVAQFKKFPGLFSRDGAMCIIPGPEPFSFIVGGEDKSLTYVNWKDGKVLRRWNNAHKKDVNRLLWNTQANKLFSAGRDGMIKYWDVQWGENKAMIGQFDGHEMVVTAMAVSPDGRRLVSGGRDNTVRLWDAETTEELAMEDVKLNIVHSMKWISELSCVAQGGEDLTIRLWDIRSNDEISCSATMMDFDYHPICMTQPTTNPGVTLYTGHSGVNGQGAMVIEWDLRQRKQVRQFTGQHSNTVRGLVFSSTLRGGNNPPILLSASDDGMIAEWNLVDGNCQQKYSVPEGRIQGFCETPEQKLLLGTLSGCVCVCSLGKEELQRIRYFGDPDEGTVSAFD